jgi:hypothetical protein
MRYRLRTLIIVLAIGPPLIWGGYYSWRKYDATRWREQVVNSRYGTGRWHQVTVHLPPVRPGYRYQQGQDGIISEVPVNSK